MIRDLVRSAAVVALLLLVAPAIAQVGLPWPGPGTPASTGCTGYCLVTSGKASDPTSGVTATTSGLTTTGANLIVAECSYFNNGGTTHCTLSDNKSNTFTDFTSNWSSGSLQITAWYVTSPTVGTGHTFTFGSSNTATFFSGCVEVWNKTTGAPSLDSGKGSFAAAAQPGSITPSGNNELIFSMPLDTSSGLTFTVDSSFAISQQTQEGSNVQGGACGHLVQGTAAAVNPTWDHATISVSGIQAFQ